MKPDTYDALRDARKTIADQDAEIERLMRLVGEHQRNLDELANDRHETRQAALEDAANCVVGIGRRTGNDICLASTVEAKIRALKSPATNPLESLAAFGRAAGFDEALTKLHADPPGARISDENARLEISFDRMAKLETALAEVERLRAAGACSEADLDHEEIDRVRGAVERLRGVVKACRATLVERAEKGVCCVITRGGPRRGRYHGPECPVTAALDVLHPVAGGGGPAEPDDRDVCRDRAPTSWGGEKCARHVDHLGNHEAPSGMKWGSY